MSASGPSGPLVIFLKHELLPLNVTIYIENGSKFQFSPITCSLRLILQYTAYSTYLV